VGHPKGPRFRREKEIKAWRRSKKISPIGSMNPRWEDLARDWPNVCKPRSGAVYQEIVREEARGIWMTPSFPRGKNRSHIAHKGVAAYNPASKEILDRGISPCPSELHFTKELFLFVTA
jgi:hypothetical protein